MKKISVITLHNVLNYGSVLQSFATQKIFEELGYEVDFINYIRPDLYSPYTIAKEWCKNYSFIKKLIAIPILWISFFIMRRRFACFIRNCLNVQKKAYYNDADFADFKVDADVYCTGSDQTWNSGWNNGILKPFFLFFVPDSVKKIAYAASFGKGNLDEFEKNETKTLLNRYSLISVREQSGVDIIESLGIRCGASLVLDPTLQVSKDFWQSLVGKPKIREPYLLIYQLNSNSDFDSYARKVANIKGLKLVRLCIRWDSFYKCGMSIICPEVLDFVNLINYANLVITDSFHATAFSINLNKDFISIYPKVYSGRLDGILSLTHLEDRHLTDYNDFSLNDKKINYSLVNDIINEERTKGWNFLKSALLSD